MAPAKLIAVTTVAFCTLALGTVYGILYLTRSIPFESARWKSSEWNRPRMVDDLISMKTLHNMERTDVVSLLGPPGLIRDGIYVYWAGTAGIDDMWLEISFENDRVSEVKYVPD